MGREENSLLILKTHIIRSGLNFQLALILLDIPPINEKHGSQRHTDTDENSDFGGQVLGLVFGAESLRACDQTELLACLFPAGETTLATVPIVR